MAEQKLGSFEALKTATLSSGLVYQAYVSDQRIVAVKTGGQLDGGKAITMHFGALGALVGYFLEKRVQKKRAALRASFEEKPLDELLLQDPKNFEVRFDGLEGAELKKSKLGFLGGSTAHLILKKIGEKPLELHLQRKEDVAAALGVLERGLQGRLQADPKLKA
jgi:hypothetical protein